jgi:hypothetical protein
MPASVRSATSLRLWWTSRLWATTCRFHWRSGTSLSGWVWAPAGNGWPRRLSASISSRTCDLIQALIQGSATDTELARRLADLDERRRGEIARNFEKVVSRPATPEQLDELWLLTSAEVFHMLVHRSGWTPEHHEQWLVDRLMEITSDVPRGASRQRKKAPRKELS